MPTLPTMRIVLLLVVAFGCGNESPREQELEVELAKAQAEKAKADAQRMRDELEAVKAVKGLAGSDADEFRQVAQRIVAERADRAAMANDKEVRDLNRQIDEFHRQIDELSQPLRDARLAARAHYSMGDGEANARLQTAKRRVEELQAKEDELMRGREALGRALDQAMKRVRGCHKNPDAWGCDQLPP